MEERSEITARLLLTPDRDGQSCFTFFKDQPYKWVSKTYHPIYTNNRRFQSMPRSRTVLTNLMLDQVEELQDAGVKIDAIAATHSSAIYHADGIARELDMSMITVRPEPKDHGTGSVIDGIIDPGAHYLVVEDLFSTGGSALKVVQNVREAGGKVSHALSIVTYGWPETARRFTEAQVTPVSLVDFPVILQTAVKLGYVSEKMMSIIADWQQDPMGWAGRHGYGESA